MRNYSNYQPVKGEEYTEPSLTVPNHSIPLKTLLDRYVRGGDVVQFPAVYTGENDNLELDKLSTIERAELLHEVKQGIAHSRANLQKMQQQKAVETTGEPHEGAGAPSVNEDAKQTKQ